MSVFMFLVFGTAGAFAGEDNTSPPGASHTSDLGVDGDYGLPEEYSEPPLPSSHCSDGKYLYVITEKKISQYNLSDLALVDTVDLTDPKNPMYEMNGPGVFIEGDFLYILRGAGVLQYTVPDLELKHTVDPE